MQNTPLGRGESSAICGIELCVEKTTINRLQAVASTQHGLFTSRQAAELGASARALEYATHRGWLRSVRPGVYAFAGLPPMPWEAVMAAALAAGSGAAVAYTSAAVIHRFHGIRPKTPELTVLGRCGTRMAGVRIHRTLHLPPSDLEQRRGIAVTTPIRTLIDITRGTSDYLIGRILDDGATRRLWRAEEIAWRLDQSRGAARYGTLRLRRMLDDRRGEGRTDSVLEQRVLRVLRGKVPDPVLHHQEVLDDRVIDMDMAWLYLRLDGEVDGFDAHRQRTDFDRDRVRHNVLAAHGWRLVHWTSTMDDATIVAQILPFFSAGTISGDPSPYGWRAGG